MRQSFAIFILCLLCLLTLSPHETVAQSRKSTARLKDSFLANSVWVDDDKTLMLTVLERKGEAFRGKLVSGDSVERTFAGTVKNGRIAWLAKDVQATKGGQGGDNTGTISGNRIDFEYRSDAGMGTFTLRRRGAPNAKHATGVKNRPSPQQRGDESGPKTNERDFLLHIKTAGQPQEQVAGLREALKRLDQLANQQETPGFEATVMLFADTKTYNSPREARKGIETIVLTSFDRASREYGVTIVATPVQSLISSGYLETTPPEQDDVLVFGLEAMRFLSGFKPQAIRRTGLKGIVLCEKYLLNGRPYVEGGGAMQDMLVLEIKNLPEGMGPNFYHELYHVYDMTTLAMKARIDPEWQALNPPGFAYKGYQGFFGTDGKANKKAFTAAAPDGFVSVYAAADIMEDKAVTYSAMMASPDWLAEAVKKDARLNAKVELLETRLRLLGPEYHPGFWRATVKTTGD